MIHLIGANLENPGSILQLQNRDGSYDNYFIDNSKNFLNVEYEKHSNFSTGFVSNDFDKQGKTEVPRWGDLVDFHLIVESNYKLTNLLLLRLLKRIKLSIGGDISLIDIDFFSYFTFLMIKGKTISENKCYNKNSKIVYKYSLKLPFIINERLPLIALPYTPVYVECHLNKFKDDELQELSVTAKLGCDYVFVGERERKELRDLSTDYNFLLDNIYTICSHNKISDSDTLNIDLNIFSKSAPHKYLVFYIHSKDYFDPSEFNMDPIIDATLYFNGKQKEVTDSNYIRLYDPKRKLGRELPLGMYMISFSLHPDKIEPSGTANFFKLEEITLNIRFPDIPSPDYKVTVCGCYTNIFHIKNGYGLPRYN